MFYPAKMCKVRLIERKANLEATVGLLESFGGAEIKKFSYHELQNAKPLDENGQATERLVRAEGILATLPEHAAKQRISRKDTAAFLNSAEARKIGEKIGSIEDEKQKLQSEIDVLKDDRAVIRNFSSFNIDFSKLDFETLDVAAGIVGNQNEKQFEKALKNPAILRSTHKPHGVKGNMHLAVVAKGNEQAISEIAKSGFERVALPKISTTPSKELEKIEGRIEELRSQIEALDKELAKISSQHYSKFAAGAEYLKIEAEKSGAPINFGSTEHTIIVEAYVPEKNLSQFEAAARQALGQDVYIHKFSSEQLEKSHEQAPTLLEHNKFLEPFEFMTKFVSLPKNNEIDPTMIFVIFFPIFYAMMVGDFIYGILSFLIARVLMKKFAPGGIMNPVAKIWMWSAIPTIIFGIIYDEYAGMPHKEILGHLGFGAIELYHGIERIHNVNFLLTICVLIGIFTMALGFLLGFVNARRHGNNSHAIAKLGWYGVTCAGTVLLSSALFPILPKEYIIPSAIALVASLGAIVKGEGVMGIIELPSLLSNVLSFARIIAVGLVGTVIALILNGMAFPSPDKGILLIVLIPLYMVGHLFNAGMAMFESFIQGARLNYVEFYSKFFEGGGKEFSPFKFERRYLKD